MSVNWNDQAQVQKFKTYALSQGYSPDEFDSLAKESTASATPAPMTPSFSVPSVQSSPPAASMPQASVETMAAPSLLDPAIQKKEESAAIPDQTMSKEVPMTQTQSQPIIPMNAPVTQPFGNRSRVERYSGGVNLGTDFSVPAGTPLAAPPGSWQVVEARPGFNDGSGNMVKIRNMKTGETIGYEHLTKIGVHPGQTINGSVIGLSGGNQPGPGRGNSTGAHASIPYTDSSGRYQDIRRSPYGRYLAPGGL